MAQTPGTPARTDTLDLDTVRAAGQYADSWVALRRRTQQLPGVQLVVAVKGEVLVSSAHGYARLPGSDGPDDTGDPLTERHLFRIASHSKTFTATAVMQLVERGAVRLDDTVGQHVPAIADSPVADRTLAELLAHGGGLVRDTHDSDFWQLHRPFLDADALVAACFDAADVLPANQRFKYSNIGYGLLGLVIEAVTGQSYADYVRVNIVERLGLRDTGPELDPSRSEDHATGYTGLAVTGRRIPIDPIDTAALASATGFWSTARDLARYASAHVLGEPILLTDESKRRMHKPTWAVTGTPEHYGLGFGIHTLGERTMIGHGGGFPGYITRTLVDPEDGLTVVVLTSCTDGPALALAQGVVALIDAALESRGRRADPHAATADLAGWTGRFASLWGISDIVDLGGRLRVVTPDQPDPTVSMSSLEIQDADTLRICEAGGYSAPGELVRYQRDGGRITSIRLGGGTLVPLGEHTAALEGRNRISTP